MAGRSPFEAGYGRRIGRLSLDNGLINYHVYQGGSGDDIQGLLVAGLVVCVAFLVMFWLFGDFCCKDARNRFPGGVVNVEEVKRGV